ncbi:MAG: sigma-70 family RNA polymerase sigma factor [Marinifilaceae bacterium]
MQDKEIFELFNNPSTREEAFKLIVKNYQERLYWHIRKIVISHHDTDDVLQNTFVRVWKGLNNFRWDAALYTWMYRIATIESISFLEEKKRKTFGTGDDIEDILLRNLKADEYFDGDIIQMQLQKAIVKLPGKQRIVFNMKYFDSMKYTEMAEILETSVGALKASYHHAVKKIEETLRLEEV